MIAKTGNNPGLPDNRQRLDAKRSARNPHSGEKCRIQDFVSLVAAKGKCEWSIR
jgi:hypothetical protein